jgi:hypothetical protein
MALDMQKATQEALQDQEQEISNWAHYWLRKSVSRFADFLLPATDKPKTDLVEPAWLHTLPDPLGAVISFLVPTQDGVLIISMINNLCQHGAWLASWPVKPNGEANGEHRGLWQPMFLRILVDLENRTIIMQQEWKNPHFISNFLIGVWAEDAPEWQLVLNTIQRNGRFTVMVPALKASYAQLKSVPSAVTRMDKDMLVASVIWKVNFVGVKKAPAVDDTADVAPRILH